MNIQITKSAQQALLGGLSSCDLTDPVVTIFRGWDSAGKELGWVVGLFSKKRLDQPKLVNIEGMDFYVDEDRWPELNGKTLDYQNGHFYVR